MKTTSILSCVVVAISVFQVGSLQLASADGAVPEMNGDRAHAINMIYAVGAFVENGGWIIDITGVPSYAKGSGNTADADHNTKAFIAVYDFIMEQLDKYGDMQ